MNHKWKKQELASISELLPHKKHKIHPHNLLITKEKQQMSFF